MDTERPLTTEKPTVVIVGRPNVGKSTLVNRILGRREAIVEHRPGVTRDRKTVEAEWQGSQFLVVDTGGWMVKGDELDDKVSGQAEKAIAEGDVILLVVDASVGLTDEDARVGELLLQVDRPVFVVANKVDDSMHEHAIWEFMSLGLGEPIGVSALHGRGAGDLLDAVVAKLPEYVESDDERINGPVLEDDGRPRLFAVAIVGRPNVGKSTLFNQVIGADRSVVHDRPGTTRDTVDTVIDTRDGPVRFIDTAGMRRRAKIDEDTEYYSAVRALRAVDGADVALLVIDSTVGVTHQDQRLAERVDAAGCPIVVLLNKWELLDAEQREDMTRQLGKRLHFIGDAPVLRISALSGKGVHRLWPALADSIADYSRRIPTRQVNDAIRRAQAAQPAPSGGRVLYATQGATDPPTFTLFANKELPSTYVRYLERSLKEAFDLGSTPIKVRVRRRD